MTSKSQYAFTLIEMLIVLTIMAVIVSFALPSFHFAKARDQDEQIKSQLVHAITLAHEYAQLNGIPIAMCKSRDLAQCGGEWRDGLLVFRNSTEDGVINDNKQIISVIQFKHITGKLLWRAFPFYRDYLLLVANNDASVSNSTFWYCHANEKNPVWAIVINKAARTRVIYPDKSGVIIDGHGNELTC